MAPLADLGADQLPQRAVVRIASSSPIRDGPDDPVRQAAWIYAQFQDTCGTPGDAEASFTRDELLDDVMLYWLPNSGASAARLYWEMT